MGCVTQDTLILFDRRMTFIEDKDTRLPFHEDVCRLCGQKEPPLWNLFEACDNNGNLNLAEKILICLNIMVQIDDGLPNQLCEKCMTVVRCFFEFRQQCLSQDAFLRKSLLAFKTHQSFSAKNSLCDSSHVSSLECNENPLDSSHQHVEESNTPESHYLQDGLDEETSVPGVKMLQRSPEAPWRIDIESSNEENKNTTEKTTSFARFDADPLSLTNELDSSPISCSDQPINHYEQESGIFINPDTSAGDVILINKADSETECIDIESIEDTEICNETDQVEFKEICAGRISHNNDGLWKCNICGYEFITFPLLQKHIKRHYSQYPNQCLECDAFFETSDDLDLHQIHHITSCLVLGHSCHHCYKSFRLKHLLKKHLEAEHVPSNKLISDTKKFRETCGKCARVFYSSFEMENHEDSCGDLVFDSDDESSEENSPSKPNNKTTMLNLCHLCKLSFDSVNQLFGHLRLFHKDEQLKCNVPECNKTCKTISRYRYHLNTHRLRFVCNTCKRGFSESYKLKDHLRIHTGEKPYKCPFCSKRFGSFPRLAIHKRQHTKHYKCKWCGYGFGSNCNLQRHIKRVHLGLIPKRICEYCGDDFSSIKTLRKHCFSYHSDKYFSCFECKRVFANQVTYERHQSLVHCKTGNLPCEICFEEFSSDSALSDHIKECHS